MPFNSLAGFEALRESYAFPQVTAHWKARAEAMFRVCEEFQRHPREGFQEPFASDIPTLAIGGTWDQQTSWEWGAEAIGEFTNAQAVVVPETGHGSLLHADCVSDTGLAFTNDPGRDVSGACAGRAPVFEIAPWVEAAGSDVVEEASLGPSFDCADPASDTEAVICEDPRLAALDRRLADRFAAATEAAGRLDTSAGEAASELRAMQRGWVSGRDECWKADDLRACVEDAYLKREGELVAGWMLEPPVETREFACDGNPANVVTALFFDTERPSARLEYGDGVDTATLEDAGAGRWEGSFGHRLVLTGTGATFIWTDGAAQDCVPME